MFWAMAGASVAGAIFVAMLLIGVSYVAFPPAATFPVNQDGEVRQTCVGDSLGIVTDLQIVRAPIIATFFQTWWSKDTNRVEIVEATPLNAVYKETGATVLVVLVQVPELPPGQYEFRLAVRASSNGTPDVFVIPVNINTVCP